jgi:acetoacetate decarboxylase
MPLSDFLFQALSTVQDSLQATPRTIASAATIDPTTFITFVSGVAAVVNITPPVVGQHMLILIPTGAWTTTAAGNIKTALAANVANVPVLAIYNPIEAKYYVGKLALTAV